MLLRPLLRTIKQRTEKIAHSSLMITLTEGAEKQVSKLLENLYRAINIGLVNEMKIICKTLNIDIFNTINNIIVISN